MEYILGGQPPTHRPLSIARPGRLRSRVSLGSCGPAIPATWPAGGEAGGSHGHGGLAARARPLKRAVCLAGVAVVTAAPLPPGHAQPETELEPRGVSCCLLFHHAPRDSFSSWGNAARGGAAPEPHEGGGTRVDRGPRVKCTGWGTDATGWLAATQDARHVTQGLSVSRSRGCLSLRFRRFTAGSVSARWNVGRRRYEAVRARCPGKSDPQVLHPHWAASGC
jgi:hypothetical protein